ncbi:MAG: DUF2608 domain-containing protein [bacterium]|nr:DUF2608 domain-containing protein [bacterium]
MRLKLIIFILLVFSLPAAALHGAKTISHKGFPPILDYLNKDNINLVVVDLDSALKAEPVRPMEKQMAQVIAQLQAGKIKLIGLTSRSPAQAGPTQNQLRSLGIHLSPTALVSKSSTVGKFPGVAYVEGILYTGSQTDAGQALGTWLNQLNFIPQVLLYVDDSLERIQQVHEAVKKLPGIEFISIHYQE